MCPNYLHVISKHLHRIPYMCPNFSPVIGNNNVWILPNTSVRCSRTYTRRGA